MCGGLISWKEKLNNELKTKLRICHFAYSFFPTIGGLEEMIHGISTAMLSHNCETYVLAPYVRGRDNRVDVPYKVFRYSRPSSRRFGLRQLLIPLLWHHLKYRFDILHCHGVYPAGYIGASFHKITGIPFVITPHGGDVVTNDKGFILNERVMNRVKRTFSSVSAITAISSDMRTRVLNLGAIPDKVSVIPNGIFLNEFRPLGDDERLTTYNNDPYILYLGRLVKVKGIDTLIRAFSKISKHHPRLRLIIAGDGKDGEELKSLALELHNGQKIEFVGTVRGHEKINLLKKALFFVYPKVVNNIGIASLEALASGLPVITSSGSAVSEVIRDGENGFLVEPANPNQLAEKMDCLLKDSMLRKRIGEQALKTASRYDWITIVKDYINIYKGLVGLRAK